MNTDLSMEFAKEFEVLLNKKLNELNILLPNQTLSATINQSADGQQTQAVIAVIENDIKKNIEEVFPVGSEFRNVISFTIYATLSELSNKKFGSWSEVKKAIDNIGG